LTSDTSVGLLKTLTLALSQRERGLIGGCLRSTPTGYFCCESIVDSAIQIDVSRQNNSVGSLSLRERAGVRVPLTLAMSPPSPTLLA
jgi:hypothetical protein